MIEKKTEYYHNENGTFKVEVIEPKNYQFGVNYNFDVGHAEKYGLHEAIILNNLIFWIRKNIANNNNYFDGNYWTYNSIRAFKVLFPFFSEKQIRTALNNLIEKGVIITGNYNKIGYDRTLWYAIIDKSILPTGQIELTEGANRIDQQGEPIPYNKPDKNHISIDDIDDIYKEYPSRCNLRNQSLSKSNKDKEKIKKMLKDKTKDEMITHIKKYVAECARSKAYMMNFSTFLNQWPEVPDMPQEKPVEGEIREIGGKKKAYMKGNWYDI